MKRFALALIATILITGAMMAQTNYKHMIITIAQRSSTFGVPVKIGDFIYITADSSMYVSKVALGASATGTYLTGNSSRYSVVKIASGRNALTATTLDVSGAATLGATVAVTGDVAVNTNKFNVTAASGNTAIAGTLGVTGNVAVNTNKFTVAASSGNTVVAGTLGVTGVATFTAAPVATNGYQIGTTDTVTDAAVGT